MFVVNEWEMFYTDSKNDEYLVDQVSIDVKNKRYMLEIDANDMVTDGYDELGNEIRSTYVIREVFDIIISGLKQKNYIELVENI